MSKKRTNPRRRPATMADLAKAQRSATSEAVEAAFAISLTVLRDKYGFTGEALAEYWGHVNKLSEEIAESRITVADLKYVLRSEEGIVLR